MTITDRRIINGEKWVLTNELLTAWLQAQEQLKKTMSILIVIQKTTEVTLDISFRSSSRQNWARCSRHSRNARTKTSSANTETRNVRPAPCRLLRHTTYILFTITVTSAWLVLSFSSPPGYQNPGLFITIIDSEPHSILSHRQSSLSQLVGAIMCSDRSDSCTGTAPIYWATTRLSTELLMMYEFLQILLTLFLLGRRLSLSLFYKVFHQLWPKVNSIRPHSVSSEGKLGFHTNCTNVLPTHSWSFQESILSDFSTVWIQTATCSYSRKLSTIFISYLVHVYACNH